MRLVGRAEAAGRIAAKRHDMAHARIPIGADDLVHLGLRRGDAGEMRGRLQIAFPATMRETVAWVRSRVEPPAP